MISMTPENYSLYFRISENDRKIYVTFSKSLSNSQFISRFKRSSVVTVGILEKILSPLATIVEVEGSIKV